MAKDGFNILIMIRRIMCGVEYNLQDTWALFKDDRILHMLWQKPNINNGEYKTHFEACITVLYSYGFYIPVHPYLLKEEMKAMKVNDLKNQGRKIIPRLGRS